MSMGSVRVKINSSGARAILSSAKVQADLDARAGRIKASADTKGSGVYEAVSAGGSGRARAVVKTTDVESMASNRKHNTLLKSLDAGR